MDLTCFTSPGLAPSFTLRLWVAILLADGVGLETLNLISHLIIVIENNTHCFWEKGATFSLSLEKAERIREVGRREEGGSGIVQGQLEWGRGGLFGKFEIHG